MICAKCEWIIRAALDQLQKCQRYRSELVRLLIVTGMKCAILALIAAAPAKASKLHNVQDLVTICRRDRNIDNDFCVVTIGVVVTLVFQNNSRGHSPSDGAARQAFLNWADKHPEEWNTETLIGVSRAMKAMWPCPPE
jgi:uncharacterized protein YhfF